MQFEDSTQETFTFIYLDPQHYPGINNGKYKDLILNPTLLWHWTHCWLGTLLRTFHLLICKTSKFALEPKCCLDITYMGPTWKTFSFSCYKKKNTSAQCWRRSISFPHIIIAQHFMGKSRFYMFKVKFRTSSGEWSGFHYCGRYTAARKSKNPKHSPSFMFCHQRSRCLLLQSLSTTCSAFHSIST